MKALIIGATGATGKDLVDVLLGSPGYTEVVAFVRKPLSMEHPKLSYIVTDFSNLQKVSPMIKGDVVFSCLGTSLKSAGSKDRQKNIDFEIPARFADIARQNGVAGVVLLSAYGAAVGSHFFYSMIKGELEKYIGGLAFTQYIIFRPGLLLRKGSDRFGERISGQILIFLNRLGLIRKFRPLPTGILAEKLAKAPLILPTGVHIIELQNIWRF
ncbi:MAG TPA: NAD(P)H-binding protein [Chryseolinea sp.]|nr:NAD(P)H-binding protein [Chryseolinea sp.]